MRTLSSRSLALRYGIAVLSTALALVLTFLIPGIREDPFFSFFTVAVAVSAWFGGWPGGMLATLLSSVATAYLFLRPAQSLSIESEGAIRLLAFDLAALLLTALVVSFRSTKKALSGAEERYRLLFEQSPQPMWVYDAETLRFLAVNDAAVARYGYSRDEFQCMTIKDIRPFEDVPRLIESAQLAEHQDALEAGEWRHRKKDGTVFDVLISSHRIAWEGRPARLVLAADITERKRVEDALRESEAKFRAVSETAPTAILIHDGARILYANPAAEQITGYRWPQDSRIDFWQVVHPDFRAQVRERAQARLRGEHPPGQYQFKIVRQDGEERWLDLSATQIDFEGRPALLCVGYDITEARQTAEALARSETNYRSLVENAPYAIYTSSISEDRFTSVNQALVKMLGYGSREEVLALRLSTDVYWDPADRRQVIGRALLTDTFTGYELDFKRKDGSRVSVRLGGRTLKDAQGKAYGFEGILEDITERRQLEQQLYQAQKMEAIGVFAGGLAHDFNNLLMITQSYATMLRESLPEGDRLHRHAEAILKAAERGARLTRQLLAFSRRQVLAPRVLNVNELLAELGEMLPRLIGEDIKVRMVLQPGIGRVRVDPGQLEQVVMNLATNARDAMPKGGTLTIETAEVELDQGYVQNHVGSRPGRHVMVALSDTGVGMDAETRSHIFEPFFTTKEAGRGTGLGLSSVYGIVKQSGGSIWVYSEPGRGSTFKIYLPLAEGVQEDAAAVAAPPPPATGRELTVLLVEDEEAVREATTDYLQVRGFRVLAALSGAEALQLAEQTPTPIHALVTDIVMPGMTGPELAHRFAELRPEVRVVFTSGYTGDTVLSQGMLKPGSVLLQKPFPLEELVRTLRRLTALDGNSSP
ncbi:MAG TPA: PAS domain S-box protein [Terriglobales bacterium]|nr:PAS domain S-box protein [Terriglobales bacterium]